MSEVVLLFSGQGAQKVGMGRDFYEASATARDLFQQADEALGFELSKVMFEGPDEELTRTSRCQPALFLHGLVALALLKERVHSLKPVAAAGLSLGEFTAHAAAGTFSFAAGMDLVMRRGQYMEEACLATEGGMAVMLGGDDIAVRALATECDVDVANYNAPGQIVLSGAAAGIKASLDIAKDHGVRRAMPLNVAGAYHSRLMQSAQDKLAAKLVEVEIQSPSIPVVCNYAASIVSEPAEIRTMLEKQVTGSVRWTESIRLLREAGYNNFIELGPGRVLAGLVAKIDKDAVVHSIEDLASLEKAVEALA